ncbi:hypothetical protein KAI65_01580 [Candidatus Parcubacteria bacterium]|nr:hypothetical protein [Candidatus Parcubacteria bacterium]
MRKSFNNKGFSILEASVVMGVVSIGILGVFSLILQNIQVQKVNKNILIASMLAQEGLELVRNIRDDNWIIAGNDWDLDIAGWNNDDFTIDYAMILADADDGDNDNDITEEAGTALYKDGANNFYTHTAAGNTATQFFRLIAADGIDASIPVDGVIDYYKVKSHVQWKDNKGVLKNYIAETYLYNWR